MPEQKLRWGILSTANIGRAAVIPAIQGSKNGKVAAVASRDANHGAEFASLLGIPRSYGSYEALLEDPDIDAVYIPLPNSLHHEWTIKAARAGKHVQWIVWRKPDHPGPPGKQRLSWGCLPHRPGSRVDHPAPPALL